MPYGVSKSGEMQSAYSKPLFITFAIQLCGILLLPSKPVNEIGIVFAEEARRVPVERCS